jgi:peptidoglycan-associated lipoprotein
MKILVVMLVIDFNSPKNHPNGIDAVKVSAFDKGGHNLIDMAQTDGDGYYAFEKVVVGDDVLIEYYKPKYKKDPVKIYGPLREATITVTMFKNDGPSSYYIAAGSIIASRIADSKSSVGYESPSAFGIRLEEEWSAFRDYDLSLEKREIVKQQVANILGARASDLDRIDATFTLRQLIGKDSEAATAIARNEGILPEVYFGVGDITLSPESQKALTKSAVLFGSTATDFNLIIEGYADSKGTSEYNLSLAERRGEAVRDFLSNRGIDPKRMNVISYGRERPICTDKAEDCEAKNRRASLVLRTSVAKDKD